MSQNCIEDGQADLLVQHILRRLERVEKRLRALERDKKRSSHALPNRASFSERFSENISIIGIKEAALTKHSGIRCVWMLFFFVCLACMGFFVYRTFKEFLNEPTATKVKLVEQKKYDYPTILLCPDTWLDAEKALNDGLTLAGLQYALGFLINYFATPPPYRIEDHARAKLEFEEYYNSKDFPDLVQFFKFIALDSDEFLYHCPYCRNESFEKIIMSHSICYQIPMDSTPGNAPVVADLDKLEVVVQDKTRGLLRRQSFWRLYLGLDLLLGEATRRHAEIYPHQTNTVQFVTHRFVSVSTPDNPCTKPEDAPSDYSHARCVLQCYLEDYDDLFLMTACSSSISSSNCNNHMLTPNRTHQFYPKDFWELLTQTHGNGKSEEAADHCYTRCPAICERMIYTMDIQSHRITPVQDLSNESDFTDLDSGNTSTLDQKLRQTIGTPANLTRIQFLNSAAVFGGVLTFQEVSTYSFETMVGNVGGMLSLWMGVSIMSLIQVLMFLATNWFSKRKKPLIHKRSDSYNSTLTSSSALRNSPVAGMYYCRTNCERSSVV